MRTRTQPLTASPDYVEVGSAFDHGSQELEESMHRRKSAQLVARVVFILSVLSFFIGFFFLAGTAIGFALAFGGALLAYEANLLHSLARKHEREDK